MEGKKDLERQGTALAIQGSSEFWLRLSVCAPPHCTHSTPLPLLLCGLLLIPGLFFVPSLLHLLQSRVWKEVVYLGDMGRAFCTRPP